jgi:F-type H+-transporting ATPase subunit a
MDPIFAINLPKITLAPDTLFHIGPIPITNSNLVMIIVMVAIILFFALLTRRLQTVPSRGQALGEVIVEGLFNFTAATSGNRSLARRIFPLTATLFIFILLANYAGLLPGMETIYLKRDVAVTAKACTAMTEAEIAKDHITKNPDGTCTAVGEHVPLFRSPNADLNMTLGMALLVVVLVQVTGIVSNGVGGYLKELLTPIPLAPIHIVGEFSRILSLSFRLFGNIFGGEVLVTVMYALTYVVVPTLFLVLEVFFGAIQALIFTTLTIIYFSLAAAGHGGAHADHPDDTAEEAAHLG